MTRDRALCLLTGTSLGSRRRYNVFVATIAAASAGERDHGEYNVGTGTQVSKFVR